MNSEERNSIVELPIDIIDQFPKHPYKVKDDDDMIQLIESIKENGVITPIIVRPKPKGRYEMISGHRRLQACRHLGYKAIPGRVLELDRNAATVMMVDSNLARSNILPSEKAFAYKMRLDAMKKHPGRPAKNMSPLETQLRSDSELSKEVGESRAQIQRYIRLRRTGAKLIIFDPLASYIGAEVSLNQANEVRSQMNYLIDIAKETGCAVIVVAHMNKMSGAKAMYRTSGSIDIVASARSCLLIGTSPDDQSRRIMAVQKSNLAEKGKAIEFCFEDSKVDFLRQLDMTADELVNSFSPGSSRKKTKRETAKEVLLEMLTEGPMAQRDVMDAMDELNISPRTVDDAKRELGVESMRVRDGWLWHLES